MMRSSSLARREITRVLFVSVLAMSPLIFLGFKSVFGPRVAPAVATLPPTIARLALKNNNYLSSKATLSPDGRWIARMEIAPSELAATLSPQALSPTADEIVIRAARGGQEVFRTTIAGQFKDWIPDTNNFIAQDGFDISIFAPSTRKPGAPLPADPWVATPLAFPTDGDPAGQTIGSYGSITTLDRSPITLSSDGRYAVKSSWSRGDIYWSVADLTTGKIAPRVKAGRWLDYDPQVGGSSSDITVAIAPANSQGALPLVAVLQKGIRTTPIPTPSPTHTPAQRRFLKEEVEENIKMMNGVTNGAPQPSNYKFLRSLEDFERLRQLQTLKGRLFPLTPEQIRRSTHPQLSDSQAFQIECFDLNKGKRLWTRWVHCFPFTPQIQFSPDGAALIAWSTTRIVPSGSSDSFELDDTGIDFFDPRTGKRRAGFRLYEEDFSIPNHDQAFFHQETTQNGQIHSILTFRDSRQLREKVPSRRFPKQLVEESRRIPVLRFFDTTLAREVGHLDVETRRFDRNFSSDIKHFSTDDPGNFWLFGSGDYQLLSRSQLGREFISPLPMPTRAIALGFMRGEEA